MTDEQGNVVLRQLQLIRDEMTTIRDDMRDMKDRMDGMDKHLQAFYGEMVRHSTKLTLIDGRLDRMERRLEKIEPSTV